MEVVSICCTPSAPGLLVSVAAPAGAPGISAGCCAPLAPCDGAVVSTCRRRCCPGCPADSFAGGGRLSLETVTPCTTSFTPSLRAVRAAQAISCLWRALSEPWVAAGRREEGDGVMLFWPCAMSERAQCRSARPGHCESACWAVLRASGWRRSPPQERAPGTTSASSRCRLGVDSVGESQGLHDVDNNRESSEKRFHDFADRTPHPGRIQPHPYRRIPACPYTLTTSCASIPELHATTSPPLCHCCAAWVHGHPHITRTGGRTGCGGACGWAILCILRSNLLQRKPCGFRDSHSCWNGVYRAGT